MMEYYAEIHALIATLIVWGQYKGLTRSMDIQRALFQRLGACQDRVEQLEREIT